MMVQHEEVQGKKAKVRQLLEKLALDGILLRKQCNFSWLTAGGLNLVGIATEMGVASLLITPDKEYVLCNNIEAPRIEQEEQLPEQGYEVRSYPWHDDQEQQLVKELTKNGRVGCDSPFPGTQDIVKEFNPLRYSLTPWEVERYKEVGFLTSKAIEETAQTIQPGDKECEIIGPIG